MNIFSPFDERKEAEILSEYRTKEIIQGYDAEFGVAVSDYFKEIPVLHICKCPVTDLIFYYPFGLDGKAEFYAELSKWPWYYQAERWEHREVFKWIEKGMAVLEIGSGSGAFLSLLTKNKEVNYTGLELNSDAIREAAKRGISLKDETLHTHALNHSEKYDVVCSFQVFEHISAVKELFTDAFSLLKPGGRLIIAVPNNDVAFFKENRTGGRFLNVPPHHVNLFTESSFRGIATLYNVELEHIEKEPLQDLHVDTYLHYRISRLFLNNSFMVRAFWKLKLHIPLRTLVKVMKHRIDGHTIMAVFRK